MPVISLKPQHFDARIPTPKELQQEFPLSESNALFIKQSQSAIQRILDGLDDRKLLIVGPCSIHDLESAKEFALGFKALSDEVSEHFFMVMRTYF